MEEGKDARLRFRCYSTNQGCGRDTVTKHQVASGLSASTRKYCDVSCGWDTRVHYLGKSGGWSARLEYGISSKLIIVDNAHYEKWPLNCQSG